MNDEEQHECPDCGRELCDCEEQHREDEAADRDEMRRDYGRDVL